MRGGAPRRSDPDFGRRDCGLSAEALAALGAARGQDLLAVLGRHARTEPVAPFALQVARLESPFGGHGSQPLKSFAEAGELHARVGQVKHAISRLKSLCRRRVAPLPACNHLESVVVVPGGDPRDDCGRQEERPRGLPILIGSGSQKPPESLGQTQGTKH